MSRIEQRPLTGRINLHTWRDFTKVMKLLDVGKWIFRGQEDASWCLKSGLDRYLDQFEKSGSCSKDGSRSTDFLSTFPRAEYFEISRFRAITREYQEWASDVDALIAMQHYGAETRLLDFSTAIMVSLFFAYKKRFTGKDRAIYAVNYGALMSQEGIGSNYKEYLRQEARSVDNKDEKTRWEFESQIANDYFRRFAFAEADKLIVRNTQEGDIDIIPLYTAGANRRQKAQSGVLLMPRTFDCFDKNLARALKTSVDEINNPTKVISNDISHLTHAEAKLPTALVKLVFDAQMEKDAWQFLDQANINASTMYPDLVGAAQSIHYTNSNILVDATLGSAKETLPVSSLWVPIERVTKAALSDKIEDVTNEMINKGYSHVPILDDKSRVLGVFSESTMMEAWSAGLNCARGASIDAVQEFLPINRHKADVFKFVPKKVTVANLRTLYAEATRKNERIGLILVTNDGTANKPLLGVLNIWDIPEKVGDNNGDRKRVKAP